MRDLLEGIERWRAGGRQVALARLVDVEGSGPRLPGAAMAVNDAGEVLGSVTGGCVESAVVEVANEILAGAPPRLVTFGYSDADALEVGLTCGGTVHLYVQRLWTDSRRMSVKPSTDAGVSFDALADALRSERPMVLATVVAGPGNGAKILMVEGEAALGELADPDLDRVVRRDAEAVLATGTTVVRHYGPCGEANQTEVMVSFEVHGPPPQMIVFGATDFTAALTRVAKVLGYRVTVCDARAVFATPARFPLADDIVVAWPHDHLREVGGSLGPRDAVCVLTHDDRFDVPAIVAALATGVGYIGAMGSRSTTEDRWARLRDAGVSDDDLTRVMAPIGLDLGARTPEETAVAICAEIIASRTGRPAPSLRQATGPIHP